MHYLFKFLEKNSSGCDEMGLNETLSGYFTKLVQVMLGYQPKEMVKYITSNDFQVLDLMMNHVGNKSICELLILLLNEVSEQNHNLPGISEVQTVLQQSGQSGDEAKGNSSQSEIGKQQIEN